MKHVFLFLFLFVVINSYAQSTLEKALFGLPDVIFHPISASDNYQVYELSIKQPLDHKNPQKGHFYQRVFLHHKAFDAPMVMITEGYNCYTTNTTELTRLLDANQLDIEHRFYGESLPASIDYQYLTLEQATADLHHINELFKQLYQSKWVSTGISKGGQTTIYYRYFYPNDVSASVPYVAPLNLEFEEKRIYDFLNTVGTEDCRKKIKDLQIRLLKERETVLPLLKWYSKGAKLSFDYLSLEEAFEFAVLEYPFSFWQWGGRCLDITDPDAPLEDALEHLLEVSGIDFFSDKDMLNYRSHYYQAASQMGYYGYEIKDFKPWIKALPTDKNPHAAFTPNKMKVKFDNSLPKKVHRWLQKNSNQFIYIYGALDTWTATAVHPIKGADALWFFMEGHHHGSARIRNMNASSRQQLIAKLEQWLAITIKE